MDTDSADIDVDGMVLKELLRVALKAWAQTFITLPWVALKSPALILLQLLEVTINGTGVNTAELAYIHLPYWLARHYRRVVSLERCMVKTLLQMGGALYIFAQNLIYARIKALKITPLFI